MILHQHPTEGDIVSLMYVERGRTWVQGKKGKGSKKKEASVISTHLAQNAREPWQDPELLMENMIMLESYCRSVGRCAAQAYVTMSLCTQKTLACLLEFAVKAPLRQPDQ